MKNFQDWLDCQLYSSHLKNLTKIREDALCLKTSKTNRRALKTASNTKNISFLDSSEHRNLQKSRYFNAKAEINESRIMEENINIAHRLMNITPVINTNKQIESYRKYQSLFKKNSSSNKHFEVMKARKLQNFFRISEEKYVQGVHKSFLKIRFISIPRTPENQATTFWVEVIVGLEKNSSNHYSLESLLENDIQIPLKRKPEGEILLILHCSKGLEYLNLGEYILKMFKNENRKEFTDLMSDHDRRKMISLRVLIEEVPILRKHRSFHFQVR